MENMTMGTQKHDLVNLGCQMQSFAGIEGEKGMGRASNLPLLSQVRLFFRRHLSMNARRALKKMLHLNVVWRNERQLPEKMEEEINFSPGSLGLKAGELVRVRSYQQIQATLDEEGKLKGCSFLNVMQPYCGTTQKVFKVVARFVDERNYKIKNVRGIVLLEGVMCTGTEFYGNCDRSCLFFWREEWLERA